MFILFESVENAIPGLGISIPKVEKESFPLCFEHATDALGEDFVSDEY